MQIAFRKNSIWSIDTHWHQRNTNLLLLQQFLIFLLQLIHHNLIPGRHFHQLLILLLSLPNIILKEIVVLCVDLKFLKVFPKLIIQIQFPFLHIRNLLLKILIWEECLIHYGKLVVIEFLFLHELKWIKIFHADVELLNGFDLFHGLLVFFWVCQLA